MLSSCRAHMSAIYHQLSSISLSAINQFVQAQREELQFLGGAYLWFFYLPIYWFLWTPYVALTEAFFATATTVYCDRHATHVPVFYAPRMRSSVRTHDLLLFVLPPIAVVFGALHCIAWNFHFPSHIEQLLWRIASLVITLIPAVPLVFTWLLVAPFVFLSKFLEKRYGFRPSINIPSIPLPESRRHAMVLMLFTIGAFLAGTGLVAYMLARLLLLTQAIILLRKQPESAFYAINWADFLLHI